MNDHANENEATQRTWGMGLRLAAVGGLAAVPLVLALAGCGIPKLGTELGDAPASTQQESASAAGTDARDSSSTDSEENAVSSAKKEPEPVRYGTVFSEEGADGTTIETPHYSVTVADGTLPSGWTYAYDDAFAPVDPANEAGDLSSAAGHELSFFDADGAKIASVACISPSAGSLQGASMTLDLGQTLPDDSTKYLVLLVPFDASEQSYAQFASSTDLVELFDGLTVTPKSTTSADSFGSTSRDAGSSSEADGTAMRGLSARADASGKTLAELGPEGVAQKLGFDYVGQAASPYDASDKQARAERHGDATLITTPYYAVAVPNGTFGGAWDYAYDDGVSAQDADTMSGHTLKIFPAGSPDSAQAVTYAVAKRGTAPAEGDVVTHVVGALPADTAWDVTLTLSNPSYGPNAATGLSDFAEANASREATLDSWASAIDLETYIPQVRRVAVEPQAPSSDRAESSTHDAPAATSSALDLSGASDAASSSRADAGAATLGGSSSHDGEVGGGASESEEAEHVASSHDAGAARSHDRAASSASEADAGSSSQRDAR